LFCEGDVTNEDMKMWEKEYAVFVNYLLPHWQKLFEAYSQQAKSKQP